MRQATRIRLALALALCAWGCKKSDDGVSTPAPSASAPPQLSTSWQTDPGHLLTAGESAPDFEAIAHNGQRILLSRFLHKPVVVYFYAGDATPGSDKLAEQVRDAWLDLQPRVSMVFGVSKDHNVVHRDFATERDLPFLLVSDADGAIATAFGVRAESLPATFLIDSDLRITEVLEQTPPGDYARTLEAALGSLK